MALSQPHRPSALKQQNKRHRTLGHRSKGSVSKSSKGRVSVKTLSKKAKKDLSREQRRHRSKQIRAVKREETSLRKRALGTANNPPFLVTVVPLSPSINPRTVLNALVSCDEAATTTTSSQGIVHISCSRFKQRLSFVVPPVNDLYAILDSVKVSDTLMLLWPGDEELGDAADLLLSSILAQGLPAPIHIVAGLEEVAQKKKHHARQNLLKEIELRFPGPSKLHSLEKEQDAILVLRQIGAQKRRPIFFRDNRPHIMAEKMEFLEEGSTGVLKVHGYVRGQVLSVNGLVHIPGWGDYQMNRIDIAADPHPLERHSRSREAGADMEDDEVHLLQEADPALQEQLKSTNEIDPLEGEQTWPTEEELAEAGEDAATTKQRTKRVPKGTSDYQAAWILNSDDEEDKNDDDDDENSESEMDEDLAPVDTISQNGYDGEGDGDEDDNEEYETMTVTDAEGVNYDEKVDYEAEMDAFDKMRAARDDAMFPDEVDTPQDLTARIRFQKFRGLQSFRTSAWDPDENLPVDYSRIFQFENFQRTKKRVLKEDKDGALPGWYVVVHISDVPRHLYDNHVASHSPLVVLGLLPHEQKMSIVNMVVKSHPSGHFRAIKSKERLIFHVGFRRFANAPIFSEHSTGTKHKFARYFHPGTTVVATMFAPITFPPASVLVFRERPDGAQDLVATGSLLSVDPKRIVTKRVVLSGHPFKVNRKTAVIRYMFFNREDVMWFRPVELRTKWGRRGHIKEPLGTHGHMKCHFDGQLKSQDTVLLNLYKRVFPKWTFDPYVARPPPLYTFRSSNDIGDKLSDEDDCSDQQPALKKAKTVKFFSSRQ
ncbi:pre-rRNA-processing protein TSR1 homolog isoform X2 [Homarus americanus]|uniref:pre-rRNA-processing protein TSR1 homolog isoform X2 n=1 Tax=Homarus americanus TaxID=6706 RepID=UPI001C441CA6|nr:pre-rRNA-processing protein TSR1 homolog isoform X2 [Homarus americanus]